MTRLAYLLRDLSLPKSIEATGLATAFPKPSQFKRRRPSGLAPFKTYPDGREVCLNTRSGRFEYARRREEMYWRDNGICCICHTPIDAFEYPTFEHTDGRGMGGARRDDRTEFNGVAHLKCNAESGSKREVCNDTSLHVHTPEQELDAQLCLDCDSIVCLCSVYEGGAR
jgi:hypothetical protein